MVLLCFYLFDIMLYAQMLKMWILKIDKVSNNDVSVCGHSSICSGYPKYDHLGTQLWL